MIEIIDLYAQKALPRNAENEATWRKLRPLSDIKHLVVHWNGPAVSSDELSQLKGDAAYHIQKDWNVPHGVHGWAIMYHYAIGRSGKIYRLNPESHVTWHATNANPVAIGVICILGEGQTPTKEMLASLQHLSDYLCYDRPDLPNLIKVNVGGHGEFGGQYHGMPDYGNATSCPGPDLLRWVRNYRVSPSPVPVPVPIPEPTPVPVPQPTPAPEPAPIPTGHTIGGGFKEVWDKYGLYVMGWPITDEYHDGEYIRQRFENVQLRWKPGDIVRFDAIGTILTEKEK